MVVPGGLVIKRMRNTKRYTQFELSELCDCDVNSVGRWERGESEPSWTKVFAIGERIGFKTMEVFNFYLELQVVAEKEAA